MHSQHTSHSSPPSIASLPCSAHCVRAHVAPRLRYSLEALLLEQDIQSPEGGVAKLGSSLISSPYKAGVRKNSWAVVVAQRSLVIGRRSLGVGR
eukprot:scaffold2329_cov247-Pinguiococcus_pyrenoidosus.AAC.22